MTQPTHGVPDFAQTLRDVLALPPEDQVRLWSVLERLTGSASARVLPGMPAPPEPVQTATDDQDASEWLAELAELPPWTQLQLLDEALEEVEDPREVALLAVARSQLLQAHPPLAVRRAVVGLATRQPIATCLGSIGLVVGLVGIGRMVARLMF